MKCPKCGSGKINEYIIQASIIWCGNCGFETKDREKFNPLKK